MSNTSIFLKGKKYERYQIFIPYRLSPLLSVHLYMTVWTHDTEHEELSINELS